jgi:hypothetical protein
MLFESLFILILKAAVTGAVAGTVIAIICLNWERIVAFMNGNTALKDSDIDNVGFSLQEKMETGNFKTVYGIFNTRNQKVLAAEAVSSQQVDVQVAAAHRKNPLVVFPN